MYVVIVGGGKVGYYLTKDLLSQGYEVTLLDWNFDKVRHLQKDLGDAVIFANGSSIDGLEKAGCSRADVIVAVTDDDEDNLVVCQLGKRYFNVPKAVARINNPKNEKVFEALGIGTTISSTTSIVEVIERYVAKRQITSLLSFDHNEMVLLEAELQEDSPVSGHRIREIDLPYNCVIVVILRGKNVIFAKGDLVLESGDMLIAVSTQEEKNNVRRVLLGD